jgi:transcriptional regulator with XRE-family HTH domain
VTNRISNEQLKNTICYNIKNCCDNGKSGTNIEIAKKLNITYRQLSNYKNGTSEPSAIMIYLMADLFKIDIKCMYMTCDEWIDYVINEQ